MHARMSRFAGLPPERIDQTLQEFESQALPNLEGQPGYEGVMVMVNRGSGQAAAITFWESAEALKASERAADEARDQAVATAGPRRDPAVDRYEVLLQRLPAGRT